MSSKGGVLIAPSILSADFGKLAQEVQEVEAAGADWIHVDVMDGHFVPNLTIGPPIVKALRPVTRLPLDCHLMIEHPDTWIDAFAKAGANTITVHAEATAHLHRTLGRVRESGCQVGLAINPATSLAMIEEVLDMVDLVLVMSVNPGFGGQKFIPSVLDKISALSQMKDEESPFLIEVDGGVTADNVQDVVDAGADVLVAGSAVFGAVNRAEAIADLKRGAQS